MMMLARRLSSPYIVFAAFLALLLATKVVTSVHAEEREAGDAVRDGEEFMISDASVLLPITQDKSKPSKYLLTAEGGCFFWTSTNPYVVDVDDSQSKPGECSLSAVIRVITHTPVRDNVMIVARDVGTGRRLTCEVFVDTFHRMEITTTSRSVYVNEVKELSVLAFDKEGNLFTSLASVPMSWYFTPLDSSKGYGKSGSPLRKIAASEAMLSKSKYFDRCSMSGLLSEIGEDLLFIQGTQPGCARIVCELERKNIHSVAAVATLDFCVLERYRITPYEVKFSALGAVLPYHVETLCKKEGEYRWISKNESIATVDYRGKVSAKSLGSVEIGVSDVEMPHHGATVRLEVVEPSRISFSIYSVREHEIGSPPLGRSLTGGVERWNLIEGRPYVLTAKIQDAVSHDIAFSENLRKTFRLTTESTHFRVVRAFGDLIQPQGSFPDSYAMQYIVPSSIGKATFHASVVSGKSKIEANQNVEVHGAVKLGLQMTPLALAYEEGVGTTFNLTEYVSGGSGLYTWSSSDMNIVEVIPHGADGGLIVVKGEGEATIRVLDANNQMNFDSVHVVVKAPTSLYMSRQRVEMVLGTTIRTAITFFAGEIPLNAVQKMSLTARLVGAADSAEHEQDMKTEEEFNFSFADKNTTAVSLQIASIGNRSGFFEVELSHGECPGCVISTFLLQTYFPLELAAPRPASAIVGDSNVVVLAPLSEAELHFIGGPKPWAYDIGWQRMEVESSNTRVVEVRDTYPKSGGAEDGERQRHVVKCLKESTKPEYVVLSVRNKADRTNPEPVGVDITVEVRCVFPHELEIRAVGNMKMEPLSTECYRQPETVNGIAVIGGRTIQLRTSALDSAGREFANFSSLKIEWTNSDPSKVSYVGTGQDSEYFYLARDMEVFEDEGFVDLEVKNELRGLRLLKRLTIMQPCTLEAGSPETILMLNRRGVSHDIRMVGGCLMLGIACERCAGTALTVTDHLFRSSMISTHQVRLSTTGTTGTSWIEVGDSCLKGNPVKRMEVVASHVSRIEVLLEPRTRVMVGEEVQLRPQVYPYGHAMPFGIEQLEGMNLSVRIENPTRSVLRRTGKFGLLGESSGVSYVALCAGQSPLVEGEEEEREVEPMCSSFLEIEVFDPFNLYPHELILLPRAHFHLISVGGPSSSSRSISFSISGNDKQKIRSENGLITALDHGVARVDAQITGYEQGESVAYGSSQTTVVVRELDGISIHCMAKALLVGTEAPLYVNGLKGETPHSYGNLLEEMRFKWRNIKTENAQLSPKGFHASIKGTREGEALIEVELLRGDISFKARLSLPILEPLKISYMDSFLNLDGLLVPPGSRYGVETSKPDAAFSFVGERDEGISLDEQGLIVTTSQSDSVIAVESKDSYHQKEYMRVTARKVDQIHIKAEEKSSRMVVGAETELRILFLDEYSRVFNALGNLSIGCVSNRIDVAAPTITAEKTILVKGLRMGKAILKVFLLDKMSVADYIHVSVDSSIVPTGPTGLVTYPGTMVQFSTVEKGSEGRSGAPASYGWWSSDPQVFTINAESGEAKMISEGDASVSFESYAVSTSKIKVRRIANAEFGNDDYVLSFSSVGEKRNSQLLFVPVEFFAKSGEPFSDDVRQNFGDEVECAVSRMDFAVSVFSSAEGRRGCLVYPKRTAMRDVEYQRMPNEITLAVLVNKRRLAAVRVQVRKPIVIPNRKPDIYLAPNATTCIFTVKCGNSCPKLTAEALSPAEVIVDEILRGKDTDDANGEGKEGVEAQEEYTNSTRIFSVSPMSQKEFFSDLEIVLRDDSVGYVDVLTVTYGPTKRNAVCLGAFSSLDDFTGKFKVEQELAAAYHTSNGWTSMIARSMVLIWFVVFILGALGIIFFNTLYSTFR